MFKVFYDVTFQEALNEFILSWPNFVEHRKSLITIDDEKITLDGKMIEYSEKLIAYEAQQMDRKITIR